jgi:hypothetical protein
MPAFLFAVPIARKKSRHKKFAHSSNQQRLILSEDHKVIEQWLSETDSIS